MSVPPVIVWFRQDLRLADNPALARAVAEGAPVIPVYVLDDRAEAPWAPGGASRWWLHHALAALGESLRGLGTRLILRRGDPERIIPALREEAGAGTVCWNRCYEPHAIARDTRLKAALRAAGAEVASFNASLIREPWEVRAAGGAPYKVFSAHWRAMRALGEPDTPQPPPDRLADGTGAIASDDLDGWGLLPTRPDWAGGLRAAWRPGEAGARARLDGFLDGVLTAYAEGRDRPGEMLTSRLSPHLHFGEIGPRQVWHAVLAASHAGGGGPGAEKFLQELAWREFSHSLLFHNPDMPEAPLRDGFARFPWRDDEAAFRAWCRGETGYPVVDAGMRELWRTGYMHNRVRMVVASFLTKHLLIHWRRGAEWFWDTLVDADLANNSASWQWVSGCGADAAPYFRIFNPVLQGERFDPDGAYVRRWVPELSGLPDKVIHRPWAASESVLRDSGVKLGATYPEPIVDHGFARNRALEAFGSIKRGE